jgi:mevalonate pyrophosphate decarboxylase
LCLKYKQGGVLDKNRTMDNVQKHNIYTKDWFRHSKVDRGDMQTHRQHGDFISLILFSQNKGSRLKNTLFCSEFLTEKAHYDLQNQTSD